MASGATESAGSRLSEVSPAVVADEQTVVTEDPAVDEPDGSGTDRIRHFDQLDEKRQQAFLRLLRGESAETTLPAGTVVVFTEYYRVERI